MEEVRVQIALMLGINKQNALHINGFKWECDLHNGRLLQPIPVDSYIFERSKVVLVQSIRQNCLTSEVLQALAQYGFIAALNILSVHRSSAGIKGDTILITGDGVLLKQLAIHDLRFLTYAMCDSFGSMLTATLHPMPGMGELYSQHSQVCNVPAHSSSSNQIVVSRQKTNKGRGSNLEVEKYSPAVSMMQTQISELVLVNEAVLRRVKATEDMSYEQTKNIENIESNVSRVAEATMKSLEKITRLEEDSKINANKVANLESGNTTLINNLKQQTDANTNMMDIMMKMVNRQNAIDERQQYRQPLRNTQPPHKKATRTRKSREGKLDDEESEDVSIQLGRRDKVNSVPSDTESVKKGYKSESDDC